MGQRRVGRAAVTVAVAVTCVNAWGCARAEVPAELPGPTSTATTAPQAPPAEPACGDPAVSLRPDGPAGSEVPAGSYMAGIRERGRLRVGVDVGTLRMSAVNPETGVIEGFDVDVAREVAAALLGSRDDVELIGLPSGSRVDALVDGRVDVVASTFTPTCRRREEVDFSAPYIYSAERVLVRRDDPARSLADLEGRPVCATANTTAIENVIAAEAPIPYPVTERMECLALLQQGVVAAAATNDTILAGFAAQDTNLMIVGPNERVEPASLGLPLGHDEFTRYVNAVLEDVAASGRWDEIYDAWLADILGPSPGPPAPTYAD